MVEAVRAMSSWSQPTALSIQHTKIIERRFRHPQSNSVVHLMRRAERSLQDAAARLNEDANRRSGLRLNSVRNRIIPFRFSGWLSRGHEACEPGRVAAVRDAAKRGDGSSFALFHNLSSYSLDDSDRSVSILFTPTEVKTWARSARASVHGQ